MRAHQREFDGLLDLLAHAEFAAARQGQDEGEQRADHRDHREGHAIQDRDGVAGLRRQIPQVEQRESPEQRKNGGQCEIGGEAALERGPETAKMPLDEPVCSSRATSQAADVDAPIVTTGMEQTVHATLIMAMSPMVLIRSLKGLS